MRKPPVDSSDHLIYSPLLMLSFFIQVLKAVNKELEHREQLLETQIKVLERRILALEASKHKLKEHIR